MCAYRSKTKTDSSNAVTPSLQPELPLRVPPLDSVILSGLPIPPSSNSQYAVIQKRGKPYFIPTRELTGYYRHMRLLAQGEAQLAFHRGRSTLKIWIDSGAILSVRAKFYLTHSKIWCKDGSVKKMDVSNRIKALHDSLSTLLGVDDSLFFHISAEKHACQEKQPESCEVEFIRFGRPA